jgi:hypothetical protein
LVVNLCLLLPLFYDDKSSTLLFTATLQDKSGYMLIPDRNASRRVFVEVWQKYKQRQILVPLEQLVLDVVLHHAEYHHYLNDKEVVQKEFAADSGRENPFLHMGMHIAIREQVATDRPAGISSLYKSLSAKHQDEHTLQHHMMECLGESLWQAQRSGRMPDEVSYLECLGKLL